MIYNTSYKDIYFVGDIHGNFRAIFWTIKRLKIENCAIVFCGDCGFGFNDRSERETFKYAHASRLLKDKNIELFFVRGNHDDPSCFDDRKFTSKYIHRVSDYSVIMTKEHNILCVGGGLSLDRRMRKMYYESNLQAMTSSGKFTVEQAKSECKPVYWEGEMPVYDEKAIDALPCKIDIVCSHVAPTFCSPIGCNDMGWAKNDESLNDDMIQERQIMDSVYNRLKDNDHSLKYWYYGHYHYYNTEIINGIKFSLLDRDHNGILCMKLVG